MIPQEGSTIKVSIELRVATRHCSDMTDSLLKRMLRLKSQITHTHNDNVKGIILSLLKSVC